MTAITHSIKINFRAALAASIMLWIVAFFALIGISHGAEPADDAENKKLSKQALESYNTKDFDACTKLCEQILQNNPNHADALNILGTVRVQHRDFIGAKKFFTQSHKISPTYITEFNLAEMDFLAKDWAQAKKSFNQVLEYKEAPEHAQLVVRFKLVIIALHCKDDNLEKLHHEYFKTEKLDRELDFYNVLQDIHTKKLDEKTARALWLPHQKAYKDTEPYVDSLLEAYYIK